MSARKTTIRVTGVLLAGSIAAGFPVACSSSSNGGNPTPTNYDSGTAPDTTTSSSGGDSSSTTDTSAPTPDSPSLDTGGCTSDASTCNSCYTAAQAAADPYNACSPYTAACIPFDPTRVPSHPSL